MTQDAEPKVSIVLPTYNGASRYLFESIKSCLDQTHRNLEVIVVDDGSNDNTPEVVEAFCDERVRYIRHEKNMRLPRALNTGFRASAGEFLTWTSDDNEYLPDAVEQLVALLRDHGEADFVYADYVALHEESGKTELRRLPDELILARKNCIGPCFLYTRRVYERIGDFNPKYELVEDYDYWTRVSKEFKMIHYARPVYVYREHVRSLKSTRTHGVVLFDNILRFERHYISTGQLARAVHQYCSAILSSEKSVMRSAVIWRKTLLRVLDLSLVLGLLFIAISMGSIVRRALKLLRRKAVSAIGSVLQPLRFIHTRYRLRPVRGQRNILCLCPSLTTGGAQAVVLSIAEALRQEGYCFNVLAADGKNNTWQKRFRSTCENVILIDPACGEGWYFEYLRAAVVKLGIQIALISNSPEAYRCLPRLRSACPNLKIMDVLHAEKWVGTSDELLWTAPYIDRRVCISDRLMSYMHGRYQAARIDPEHAGRLQVIHSGIDARRFVRGDALKGKLRTRFGIQDETKVISFVGRFSSEKRPLFFVDIAEQLVLRTRPNALKFIMAGDGQQFGQVEERISSRQLGHAFILTGLSDRIDELLADTFLLLVVSESEGIPFAILEALSAGVPVISTDVGAINEVIGEGINGYLIPSAEDSVDRFTSRVLWLLAHDEEYASLSMNARASVATEYSMDTMARAYVEVFEELASGATGHELYDPRPTEAVESGVRGALMSSDRLPIRTAPP